jgi:cyclopropane fatty-acyl-phospholipid synthase-like methyltransferase
MNRVDQLRERYEKVKKIIVDPFAGEFNIKYLFGEKYTGIGCSIGCSSTDNSSNQTKELAFTLSLSKSPMVEKLISDPEMITFFEQIYFSDESEESRSRLDDIANSLAENKVLADMKILDLGCGDRPTFAYCARMLGAEVYTVDIIPGSRLWNSKEKGVVENHIQLDLRDPKALDILLDKTKGNFDLIASASIHEMAFAAEAAGRAAPPQYLNELALALAKDTGVLFEAEYLEKEEIEVKDPKFDYRKEIQRIRDWRPGKS